LAPLAGLASVLTIESVVTLASVVTVAAEAAEPDAPARLVLPPEPWRRAGPTGLVPVLESSLEPEPAPVLAAQFASLSEPQGGKGANVSFFQMKFRITKA